MYLHCSLLSCQNWLINSNIGKVIEMWFFPVFILQCFLSFSSSFPPHCCFSASFYITKEFFDIAKGTIVFFPRGPLMKRRYQAYPKKHVWNVLFQSLAMYVSDSCYIGTKKAWLFGVIMYLGCFFARFQLFSKSTTQNLNLKCTCLGTIWLHSVIF